LSSLEPSNRAPGLLVAPGVSIADDAEIGANVVIYAGVVIEAGCRIQDGAVLGKRTVLGPHSTSPPPRQDMETRLERGAQVGCYAVIVAGAHLGPAAVVADHALVREHARLEAGAVAGHGGVLGRGCRLGARSKLMGGFILAPRTVIEEDVFSGPGLTVTDDLTMGRHRGVTELPAVMLRRACRVGSNVTVLPGLEIGEEAVVGAGSIVTRDVGARTVVLGSPAQFVRDVTDAELRERHAPPG
jgi:UDP-2-acetamido-3-amino-2,3-dideoxy-glucuronate N-acetyltransferase